MLPLESSLGKMSESEKDAPNRAHPDDFGRSVSKIAAAQVCEGVGFDFVKQSALEALTSIVVRYITDLGKSASSYANLAGRLESNVFDIVKGLEDLGSSSGFSSGSGTIKEISQFVDSIEDATFAQPIPWFPVLKTPRLIRSFSEMGESPSSKNIPDWLPAFPDPHTYMHSSVWNERKMDIRIDKGEQARQRRKAERSLLNLQQRLLIKGENGVSNVALPSKLAHQGDRKTLSLLETFAPVIDALNGGELDPMDVDRRVISKRQPVVHFKLKAGEKMLMKDLDVHLRQMGSDRRGSCFPRDDERDDKKRRVGLIIRQSMEYNQEQSQMLWLRMFAMKLAGVY